MVAEGKILASEAAQLIAAIEGNKKNAVQPQQKVLNL